MAKTKISEFDTNPDNNTDINSINIAEGCAPSGINNAIRQLMSDLKEFQTGAASDPLTVGGVATFTAGSVSAPAITTTGDTNTGIYFPAADTIAFTEGGVEAMRITSDGNVGIGTSSPTNPGSFGCVLNIDNADGSALYLSDDGSVGQVSMFDTSMSINNRANGATLFATNALERMRIDSSGNLIMSNSNSGYIGLGNTIQSFPAITYPAIYSTAAGGSGIFSEAGHLVLQPRSSGALRSIIFATGNPATEAMRVDGSGNLLVGKTTSSLATVGAESRADGLTYSTVTTGASGCFFANRQADDGVLVSLRQANTQEGTISVSGTTVSYNGGHLARWSQLLDGTKDESLLKGTVLSNLDEMCVWEKDGVVAENEQLNKMKVSDVEGDTNVAGVFVNWTKDEDYNSDDMNIAMTGDMIIRIAQGVTVQRGDLLMSAGDGTAKPQGDDIVRSKTIAKVTSTNITCTYADGSYCVPCVLMAC